MKSNFDFSFEQVLKFGSHNITWSMYKAYLYSKGEDYSNYTIQNITEEHIKDIYKEVYWEGINGDNLPNGIDFFLFDYACQSGNIQAIKSLQRVLKEMKLYNGIIDGVPSHQTMEALRYISIYHNLLEMLVEDRLKFLSTQKYYRKFKKAWRERISLINNTALSLILFDKSQIEEIDDSNITEEMGEPTNIKEILKPQKGIAGLLAGLGISFAAFRDLYDQIEPIIDKLIDYDLGIHPSIIIGGFLISLGIYIWFRRRNYDENQ